MISRQLVGRWFVNDLWSSCLQNKRKAAQKEEGRSDRTEAGGEGGGHSAKQCSMKITNSSTTRTKYCQRHKGPKALSLLTLLRASSLSKRKIQNLGKTSVKFCLTKGKKQLWHFHVTTLINLCNNFDKEHWRSHCLARQGNDQEWGVPPPPPLTESPLS